MTQSNSICKQCDGDGIIKKETLSLIEGCPNCEGVGEKDWITIAMNKHTKRSQDYTNCIYHNIENLVRKLKEEYYKLGLDVELRIRNRPSPITNN